MDDSGFRILIVGLGLIGGSLAKALEGFSNSEIYALDKNNDVLKQAESEGVIKKGYIHSGEILPHCDIVFVCLYPQATVNFINQNDFKSDTLVTDVCGVKQWVCGQIKKPSIHFIGGHPMAGKERGGYVNSTQSLFHGASYILTPYENTDSAQLALLKKMIFHIGCRKTVITTPKEHDQMISYTSQLMHVMASALCDNKLLNQAEGFSAGSLRDCTRVANLNEKMWSELFLTNKEELIQRIYEFESSLDVIKSALECNDKEKLELFLKNAAQRKRRYLNENPNC